MAFTVTSLLLISVNQSSRQTRTESILPFDIFDTITPPNYEKCARRKGYGQRRERAEIELWRVIKEPGLLLKKINISSPKMQLWNDQTPANWEDWERNSVPSPYWGEKKGPNVTNNEEGIRVVKGGNTLVFFSSPDKEIWPSVGTELTLWVVKNLCVPQNEQGLHFLAEAFRLSDLAIVLLRSPAWSSAGICSSWSRTTTYWLWVSPNQ